MIVFPAATKGGGICFGAPNVCLTPAVPSPIPTPYVNIAQWAGANGASTKVLIEMKETVHEAAKVPNSSGDEPGINGGVISGINMHQCQPRQQSSKVIAEGKKVVFLTCMTGQNGANANVPNGMHVAPSQTKVLVGM